MSDVQKIVLATLKEGEERTNLDSLFSAAPLTILTASLTAFFTSPAEDSQLEVPVLEVLTRIEDTDIRWNPSTGVTEFLGYLSMKGIDRKGVFQVTDGTFDATFRPYLCLALDPLRSAHTRKYIKSLMTALLHYPLVFSAEPVDVTGMAAKFWIERFNSEAYHLEAPNTH